MEYYSAIERNEQNNWDELPGNYAKFKKPIRKGYMLHNSIIITFWNDIIIEIGTRLGTRMELCGVREVSTQGSLQ